MIDTYILPLIIFIIGLNTIVFGKRSPLKITFLNLLLLSIIVSLKTEVMNGVLFGSIFLPLIYFGKGQLIPVRKTAHSTTQEKASVYLGLLPSFGLYFLNREKIEEQISQIHIDQSVLISSELALIFFLIILAVLSLRKRRWK